MDIKSANQLALISYLIKALVKNVNRMQGISFTRKLKIQKWKVLMKREVSANLLNPTCCGRIEYYLLMVCIIPIRRLGMNFDTFSIKKKSSQEPPLSGANV